MKLFVVGLLAVLCVMGEEVSSAESLGEECSVHTTCQECGKNLKCVWCGGEEQCVEGMFYGPADDANCTDWQWVQCYVSGLQALIVVGAGIGAIVVVGVLICCCCCCRKDVDDGEKWRRKHRYHRLNSSTSSSNLSESYLESSFAESKASKRRQEIREKYGIGASINDDAL